MWFGARLLRCWRFEAVTIALLCVTGVLWQCDPIILKWLVDYALPGSHLKMIASGAMLLLIIQCCRLVTLSISLYTSARCGQQLAEILRLEAFEKINDLPVQMVEGTRAGDILYSLEQDVDQVVLLGSEILPTLMRIFLVTGLAVFMMWRLDSRLTLVTSASMPLFLGLGWYSRTVLKKFAEESRTAASERSGFSSEAIGGYVQIRILQAFARVRDLYARRVQQGTRALLSERKRQIFYSSASSLIVAIATTVMLGVGGINVIHSRLSVGSYVAFYTYLLRLFDPLNMAVDMFARLQRASVSIARLRSLSNASTLTRDETLASFRESHSQGDQETCGEVLECSGLSFSYGNGHLAFQNISFTVRRGSRILIDGPTGAGKSTLLKILAGVYPDYQGDIFVDGVNMRSMAMHGQLVGFAAQHPVLFSGSLRDNLLLGFPDATLKEIEEALYISCSDSIVTNLSKSLDYHISQSGAGLSGGERQRIALARVLLQRRPILLLDEALTGLDDSTKRELLSRLHAYTRDRITIVASHDPVCKMWTDQYVSLCNKNVVPLVASETAIS